MIKIVKEKSKEQERIETLEKQIENLNSNLNNLVARTEALEKVVNGLSLAVKETLDAIGGMYGLKEDTEKAKRDQEKSINAMNSVYSWDGENS